MQTFSMVKWFVCEVSLLSSALYAKCPYYVVLGVQVKNQEVRGMGDRTWAARSHATPPPTRPAKCAYCFLLYMHSVFIM